jgi:hypothetical protein
MAAKVVRKKPVSKGKEWKGGGVPGTLSFHRFYVILFLMNGPIPSDKSP